MRHIHVVDGARVVTGSEAVLLAYSRVGLGWLMALLRFPPIRFFIDRLYAVVSKHRYAISRWLPGGAKLASAVSSLHDVESAAMGVGCEDEEECMLPDLDDEDFNLIRLRFEYSSSYVEGILEGIERDSLILKNIEDVLQDTLGEVQEAF